MKNNQDPNEKPGASIPLSATICSVFPWDVIGFRARYRNTFGRVREYIVAGWILDANGCFRTYSAGVQESFFDETIYSPNRPVR